MVEESAVSLKMSDEEISHYQMAVTFRLSYRTALKTDVIL